MVAIFINQTTAVFSKPVPVRSSGSNQFPTGLSNTKPKNKLVSEQSRYVSKAEEYLPKAKESENGYKNDEPFIIVLTQTSYQNDIPKNQN